MSGRIATRALATLALASLVGCEPTTVEELPRPALVVVIQEASGFCSATVAVDASNTVWREEGCEANSTGLERAMRRIDDADRARYDALMDETLALPEDGDCAVINPSARRFRFTRTAVDGSAASVLQCEPGVPLGARTLALEFESFLGAIDAGPPDANPGDGGPGADAS